MSSDNIPALSYTTNINAGAIVYTEKVIAGQYTSLNIIGRSDVAVKVIVQFSGDGTYWDYSVSHTINAGTNGAIDVTVQSKWVRLVIQNVSASNSTYFRLYTYGTPTNSAVLAQITTNNGNPTFNIGEVPVNFSDLCTIQQYKFLAGPTASTTTAFYSLYPNLYLVHVGASAVPTYSYANFGLTLSTNNAPTDDDIFDTPMYIGTRAFGVLLSARFVATTDSTLGGYAQVGFCSNSTDRVAVGYYKGSQGFTYSDWGLEVTSGTPTFISRANFNVDPCDGSGVIPVLDMTQFHDFQFLVTPFNIDMYILYNGHFVLVHHYEYNSSTRPMFRDNAVGYYMHTEINNASVMTTGNLAVTCSNWELQRYGICDVPIPRVISRGTLYSSLISKAAVFPNETCMFSIENFTTYQGMSCLRTLMVHLIDVTVANAQPCTFIFHLDATLSGAVFNNISNYTNARVDTVGTKTVDGRIIYRSTAVAGSLRDVIDRYIELKAGQVLTVTAIPITASSQARVQFQLY